MTDTTDIKALRVEIDTPGIGSVAQLRKLAHGLLDQLESAEKKNALVAGGIEAALKMQDQLEAERQRADEGAKEITYWCNLNARKNERMGELEAAEKERDEITTGILELIPDCRYMDPPDGGSVTPLEQLSRMVTELRAAPQKPVVPVGFLFVVKATGAVIYSIADAAIEGTQLIGQIYGDAAIEAAGGVVKDGE